VSSISVPSSVPMLLSARRFTQAPKGAVDVITKVLTKELGARKIRVNSIHSSLTETEGTHFGGFMAEQNAKGDCSEDAARSDRSAGRHCQSGGLLGRRRLILYQRPTPDCGRRPRMKQTKHNKGVKQYGPTFEQLITASTWGSVARSHEPYRKVI
jgi:hypothetical protein